VNEPVRYTTHVCLVSAQATPNLTPVIDPAFAPRHVVMLVSPAMRSRAEHLAAVLKRREVTVCFLDVTDPYDYLAIEECLLTWLADHDSDDLALNVTGGTKVMAMAAQEVFRSAGKPVFYVNIDSDEVLFIGQRQGRFRLGQKVRLGDYLEAHGYRLQEKVKRPEVRAWERDLTEKLVIDLALVGRGLGELNWLAQEARNGLRSPPMTDRQLDSKQLDALIDRFSCQDLLKLDGKSLVFPNEAARQFVNGGWLESHVYRVLAELAPKLSLVDYGVNLEVAAPNAATRNELDAAFLCRNRLHLIECKAANLATPGTAGETRGTAAVYKLETLLKMGGIATRGMLIDYRGSLAPADLERARQSRIEVVSGADLRRLPEKITNWAKS